MNLNWWRIKQYASIPSADIVYNFLKLFKSMFRRASRRTPLRYWHACCQKVVNFYTWSRISANTLTEDPDIRITRISEREASDPYYPDIRIIRISVLFGYPNYPYYPDILIIRIFELSAYPDPDIRIIRVSGSGYSNYPGIRIRISVYHEITDCIEACLNRIYNNLSNGKYTLEIWMHMQLTKFYKVVVGIGRQTSFKVQNPFE